MVLQVSFHVVKFSWCVIFVEERDVIPGAPELLFPIPVFCGTNGKYKWSQFALSYFIVKYVMSLSENVI